MREYPHRATLPPDATVTCRCEEILREEIDAAIGAGARTVDDVKRRTGAGMGLCQGVFCVPAIAAMMAQTMGAPIDRVAPMTARPSVRPIALESLADLHEREPDPDSMPAGDDQEQQ